MGKGNTFNTGIIAGVYERPMDFVAGKKDPGYVAQILKEYGEKKKESSFTIFTPSGPVSVNLDDSKIILEDNEGKLSLHEVGAGVNKQYTWRATAYGKRIDPSDFEDKTETTILWNGATLRQLDKKIYGSRETGTFLVLDETGNFRTVNPYQEAQLYAWYFEGGHLGTLQNPPEFSEIPHEESIDPVVEPWCAQVFNEASQLSGRNLRALNRTYVAAVKAKKSV